MYSCDIHFVCYLAMYLPAQYLQTLCFHRIAIFLFLIFCKINFRCAWEGEIKLHMLSGIHEQPVVHTVHGGGRQWPLQGCGAPELLPECRSLATVTWVPCCSVVTARHCMPCRVQPVVVHWIGRKWCTDVLLNFILFKVIFLVKLSFENFIQNLS